ncbi:PEP-CTERM sorting domain-containing protein [Massilia sp. CCM 8734]|uniref:PEP-CTERM sorting domain-containing protein n=1 Tax=Massilia sp. CCM 8734 TaxID=2609283 RepID=UPI0014248C2C|nr:PEP-CTERM sorting domain-containing protein [Massilia sp. CCM 8734]NHZ99487.1 PEP-CTERM sorting domain-containing protein [Massilia sp. CCM 8734]
MKTIVTALALSATFAAPLSASAQVSAQGTLTNFSYSLVDLLPNDGIAPSLSIVKPHIPAYPGTVAGADINESGRRATREASGDETRALYSRDLDASVSVPHGTAVATVSGGNFQNLAFDAAASTTGSVGYKRSASAWNAMLIEEFVLSPGTQITFFADVDGSVATSLPSTNILKENSSFQASMRFDDIWSSAYPHASATFKLTAPLGNSNPNLPFSQSASERLSIMFQNTKSTSRSLKLSINLRAGAESVDTTLSTSPVPEPASYGMLIAGLALVAGAARRKRVG